MVPKTTKRKIRLSDGRDYDYQLPWDGRTRFSGTLAAPIAFDTETEGDCNLEVEIPRLALAAVSDANNAAIIHPEQLADFLKRHEHQHFVGQNVAFDFWVVDKFLGGLGETERQQRWWRIADEGRLHDTMLLDMLLRLGRAVGNLAFSLKDSAFIKADLGVLAQDYCHVKIDKEDPFRRRYGELIDQDWSKVTEDGFWSYAVGDPIVTRRVWLAQYEQAKQLLAQAKRIFPKDILPQAVTAWGPLTESLQVRASLVLEYMQKRGMHTDSTRAAEFEAIFREQLAETIRQMHQAEPSVFKYRVGKLLQRATRHTPTIREEVPPTLENIILTEKSQTPSLAHKPLVEVLRKVAQTRGLCMPMATGKKGGISKSAKAWAGFRKHSPFIAAWVDATKIAKHLAFFSILRNKPVLHPKYHTLMRTGRISATKPNITNMPRDKDFRSLFIARPGFKLLTIDYSFIELRTLAAVCERRFGFSCMADVIRQGVDPHAYSAAMMRGVTVEEFMAWKTERPDDFKRDRQQAKPVNFGVPGGLGAVKLSAYARSTYGVEMTVEEAGAWRKKLIEEIYPELDLYLHDDGLTTMADNCGVSVREIKKCLGFDEEEPEWIWRMMRAVGKIIRGKPVKADGTPYKEKFVNRIWDSLIRLSGSCRLLSQEIRTMIRSRQGSPVLERALLCGPTVTLTGRVRGSATYTQARNTPFQGLAADGGKMALWDLLYAGFHVCAFVHDELLVELPEATAECDAKRAEEIIVKGMEKVMDFKLPVACEGSVGPCWRKG